MSDFNAHQVGFASLMLTASLISKLSEKGILSLEDTNSIVKDAAIKMLENNDPVMKGSERVLIELYNMKFPAQDNPQT